MARVRTRKKVHDAVLALARESLVGSLTMEGVAARAGISKQTLYRSWPTTGSILFDALSARGEDSDGVVMVPDTGDLTADMRTLAAGMVTELTDPAHDPLLRALTAELQFDETLARQYREMLLTVQMSAIARRLHQGGVVDHHEVAELFVGAIMHRWLLRSHAFDPDWLSGHVERTLRAATI